MIHVLPETMVGVSGHRLVELRPPHGLNRCHDFATPKTKRRRASQSGPCDMKGFNAGESRFESIKVVGRFSLFHYGLTYTIMM